MNAEHPSLFPQVVLEGRELAARSRGHAVPPHVVSLAPGHWVPLDAWQAAKPWERYGWVAAARALWVPSSVYCCLSSVYLHGLPLGRVPDRLFAARPGRGSAGTTPGTTKHLGVRIARAIPVVTHAHPGLQPVRAGDHRLMPLAEALARVAGNEPLEVSLPAVDAYLRLCPGRAALDELRTHMEGLNAQTRRSQAVGVLELANAGSESAGESRSRVVMARLGAEPPELQALVRDQDGELRLDFLWREARVVGEFDGRGKYLDRALRAPGRDEWDVLAAEKRRDARLRGMGFRVVHWTSAELRNPAAFARLLRDAGVDVDPRRRSRLR